MIKGAQKRMIVFHTEDSGLFDEAYFVLRQNTVMPKETDMLTEANRILEDCLKRQANPEKKPAPCLPFGIGILVGIGVSILSFWLFR